MWVKLMVLICGWFQLPPRMIKVNLFLFLLFSWQQGLIEGAANPGLQLAVTSNGLDYSKCLCVCVCVCVCVCIGKSVHTYHVILVLLRTRFCLLYSCKGWYTDVGRPAKDYCHFGFVRKV